MWAGWLQLLLMALVLILEEQILSSRVQMQEPARDQELIKRTYAKEFFYRKSMVSIFTTTNAKFLCQSLKGFMFHFSSQYNQINL